jgi:hypothetical protein
MFVKVDVLLDHPLVSPFKAETLVNLPTEKIHLMYGSREVFRDQIRLFINKIRRECEEIEVYYSQVFTEGTRGN